MCSFRQDLYLNLKKNLGSQKLSRQLSPSLVNDNGLGHYIYIDLKHGQIGKVHFIGSMP